MPSYSRVPISSGPRRATSWPPTPSSTGDRRHYFVLRLDGWKLDVSLFTAGIPPEVDESRLRILRLKELLHRRPEYPEIVGGFEIYEAVLAGAGSADELHEYLRERGLI